MSDKKEGVDPCSGKAQCISVWEYQNREEVRGGCGNRGREKGIVSFGGWENRKREMNCK